MVEYISNQERITKPDYIIYNALSDFNNFTPILKDKVEGWCVEGETCSFKVSGFNVKLSIVDKQQNKSIKLTGVDIPFEFYFWIQLKGVAPDDTRMRLVVHAKLNAMMKMMVGKKLQKGINEMASQIATAFNQTPY
ncbi:MAG: polyketide cyclase [Rikenellaceae bacterium]